jgi:hypothetical protein
LGEVSSKHAWDLPLYSDALGGAEVVTGAVLLCFDLSAAGTLI